MRDPPEAIMTSKHPSYDTVLQWEYRLRHGFPLCVEDQRTLFWMATKRDVKPTTRRCPACMADGCEECNHEGYIPV